MKRLLMKEKKFSKKEIGITLLGIGMCLFHLYTAQFGLFSAIVQRSIHLLFAFLLIFLSMPLFKEKNESQTHPKNSQWVLDIILMILGTIILVYLVTEYEEVTLRGGEATPTDLIFGAILIVLVLEATRRTMGLALPIVTVVAIAYSFWGHYIPGSWGHRSIGFEQFISFQFLTTEGLFSIPLGVSASFIFIFTLFAQILLDSGVGEFFNNMANAIAGHFRGGPAKVAVISSGTMGMISGSAVANVVTTGSFTIPLMKRIGYQPAFAGAVEAVSSTGGQIMPPIMGAAAFIIAEMVGIPYIKVCVAAAIPAVLYYFTLFYIVHLEAVKLGMKGVPRENLPSLKKELLIRGHLILPAILLVVALIFGYSPMKAGLWAIIAVFIVSMFRRDTRMGISKIIRSLRDGAIGSLQVVMACACAGVVIGVVTQTGLGLKFSNLVISAAHGNLLLSLIFIMLASLVLGMGLTTSAAYILTVIIAAPALVKLGVDLLSAHLFVFYYACLSAITPPVALAAYAAAGIAGSSPFRVGFRAMWLAIVAYIVPYFFIYNPVLLWRGNFFEILLALISSIIGSMAIASALEGYLFREIKNVAIRILLFGSGILLIKPGLITDAIGLGVIVILLFLQYMAAQKEKPRPY
jgi:TRAP transporter 4TM/12TM fusion protein